MAAEPIERLRSIIHTCWTGFHSALVKFWTAVDVNGRILYRHLSHDPHSPSTKKTGPGTIGLEPVRRRRFPGRRPHHSVVPGVARFCRAGARAADAGAGGRGVHPRDGGQAPVRTGRAAPPVCAGAAAAGDPPRDIRPHHHAAVARVPRPFRGRRAHQRRRPLLARARGDAREGEPRVRRSRGDHRRDHRRGDALRPQYRDAPGAGSAGDAGVSVSAASSNCSGPSSRNTCCSCAKPASTRC